MIKVSETRSALRRMALTKCAALTPLARRLIVPLVQSGALRKATYSNLKAVVGELRRLTSDARVLSSFGDEVSRIKRTVPSGFAFEKAMKDLAARKVEPAYQESLRAIVDRIRLAAAGRQYASHGPVHAANYDKGRRLGRVLGRKNLGEDVSIVADRLANAAYNAGDGALSSVASAVSSGARYDVPSAHGNSVTELLRLFTRGPYMGGK